jgi:hypothetical protein
VAVSPVTAVPNAPSATGWTVLPYKDACTPSKPSPVVNEYVTLLLLGIKLDESSTPKCELLPIPSLINAKPSM